MFVLRVIQMLSCHTVCHHVLWCCIGASWSYVPDWRTADFQEHLLDCEYPENLFIILSLSSQSVIIGALSGLAFNLWLGAGAMGLNVHSSLPPLLTHEANMTATSSALDSKYDTILNNQPQLLSSLIYIMQIWFERYVRCFLLVVQCYRSSSVNFISVNISSVSQ
jgi:hypothetical protein